MFVTDEGGEGDYLHSILGMQYVSFVPVVSRLFKHYLHAKAASAGCYRTCSGTSITVVSSFFMTIILYSGFLPSHFPQFILMV